MSGMHFIEPAFFEAAARFDFVSKIAILIVLAFALVLYLLSKLQPGNSKKLRRFAVNNFGLGIVLCVLTLFTPFVVAAFMPAPSSTAVDMFFKTVYDFSSGAFVVLLVLPNIYWAWSIFVKKETPKKQ